MLNSDNKKEDALYQCILFFDGAFWRRFFLLFLFPHQISQPVMGNDADTRAAKNIRSRPGNPAMLPTWMS